MGCIGDTRVRGVVEIRCAENDRVSKMIQKWCCPVCVAFVSKCSRRRWVALACYPASIVVGERFW